MKDGKPESLAEALLLLEKMNARLSEKDQKIREQQAEIKILNEKLVVSGKNVLDFLEGYEGNVIQSDGYSGYNAAINYWNLSHPDHKIELLNCWGHARRGFADAVKATKSKHAAQAIKLFKDVFDNENRLRKLFD